MLASLVKQDGEVKGSYQGLLRDIRYPLIMSPKYDGIRCMVQNDQTRSRKNLPIPNEWVRHHLASKCNGLDGELVTYTNGQMDDFHTVQSKIMTEEGQPDFKFWVFDCCENGMEWMAYNDRLDELHKRIERWLLPSVVQEVEQTLVYDDEGLTKFESQCVALGYEGACGRHPSSPYKSGRSTFTQGYLLKFKRFQDAEARIVGVEPLDHNQNEATTDETGHTKRSKAKAGMQVDEFTLGALVCVDLKTNVEFNIGTGFTLAQRRGLMDQWKAGLLKDEIVTYKHQPYGAKQGGAPRIPVFRGIRYDLAVNPIDL